MSLNLILKIARAFYLVIFLQKNMQIYAIGRVIFKCNFQKPTMLHVKMKALIFENGRNFALSKWKMANARLLV